MQIALPFFMRPGYTETNGHWLLAALEPVYAGGSPASHPDGRIIAG